ncbi:YcxB family protein [Streptomyces sp. NBC_00212]|uniref:YcxB family protein n=1 Tax=Streptomyces sp. NBC_00212 TaxID=2975684 RepID=UPI0032444F32
MSREEQYVSGMGLSYRLTAEDFKEALRARARASAAARRQRVIMLVCGSVALVSGIMALVTGGSLPMPMMVGIVVFGVLMVGMPYLQARQFHKLTANHGEYRATIADTGVTIAHQQAATTLTWQAAPRYVETPHLFVLLSTDKNASCLTILPKRGTTDVDTLRAELDRHTARV